MTEYGSPVELRLVDAEMPVPKRGEVVIKVDAIGVKLLGHLRRQVAIAVARKRSVTKRNHNDKNRQRSFIEFYRK